jgi:hypothetical protein
VLILPPPARAQGHWPHIGELRKELTPKDGNTEHKFVTVLRDPLSRAFSAYTYFFAKFNYKIDFERYALKARVG